MQFAGVKLEFLQSRYSEAVPGSITRSLARFEIQETEFSFEARSNQCQTVDLTSRSVIGYDTRYEGMLVYILYSGKFSRGFYFGELVKFGKNCQI